MCTCARHKEIYMRMWFVLQKCVHVFYQFFLYSKLCTKLKTLSDQQRFTFIITFAFMKVNLSIINT